MRIDALTKMFPNNPELVTALWTPGAEQMGTEQIAENVFKQKDVARFITDLFKKIQESLNGDYNSGYCKMILGKIQEHKEFVKYKDLVCKIIIPETPKLRSEGFGSFPEDRVSLPQMENRAAVLRVDKMAQAASIIRMLKSDEMYGPQAQKPQKEEKAFWDDIDAPYGRFRIGSCPTKDPSEDSTKDFDQVSLLFKSALQEGIRVFVSLHESGESIAKRISDFWENRVLESLHIPDWNLKQTQKRTLAEEPKGPSDLNQPRVVESTIEAKNEKDGTTIVLTHLHLDGWRDQSPLPGNGIHLFNVLQKRIQELSHPQAATPEEAATEAQRRIWYNCIGGKGRSPTTAVGHCCLQLIDQALQSGTKLDEVKVCIPEIIYTIRKARSGAVGQASHIVNLYEWLAATYQELKIKV